MCRLVFKQGLHKEKTCAILIILFKSKNVAKDQRADIQAMPLNKDTVAMLNTPNDAFAGALKQFTLWDPLAGNKHGMNKIHIIVKTTSLPPVLWVVQVTHPQSQAQHQAKSPKST
jgi:hypothetical protein